MGTEKKTMRSEEVRAMLGLSKGAWNRLVRMDRFKSYRIMGQYRVDIESFEDWYGSQWHYKKIAGSMPGNKYSDYIGRREISERLCIRGREIDVVIKRRAKLKAYHIDGHCCYLRTDFEAWYQDNHKQNNEERRA